MRSATQKALFVAGAYCASAALYIVLSSRVAAALASDVASLERIERMKGVAFILVTSAVLFVATRAMLRRAAVDARALNLQREALVATERKATAGMMAAAIAHDANNVLTALLGELALIEDEVGSRPGLRNLDAAAQRLVDLNRRLITAAKTQSETVRVVDVRQLCTEVLGVYRPHGALRRCKVVTNLEHAPADVRLRASPVLVQQILGNLLVNAGEATDGKGTVELRLKSDATALVVEVHDDGPGVPADRRENLFEALVTTKATGTGLGLYSARACATAAGFTLAVDDSPLGGACFRVTLPRPAA